ncbi:hypothetical protein D3C71_1212720 [compost metagenome]
MRTISGVPANQWTLLSRAKEDSTATSGGSQVPTLPGYRADNASIMRLRNSVISADSVPCTTPAISGPGIGCALFANAAQPPIAMKATAMCTALLRLAVDADFIISPPDQ